VIVSASYRSDIPAFYGTWFARHLAAGRIEVRNPYGGKPYRVALAGPELDGFVFWTRNARPFAAVLAGLADAGHPFYLQYSLTGYPRALETSVVAEQAAVATMAALARDYGPKAVVWRYDPVLITSLTPPAWHRETLGRLARALAGVSDEVVLSFAQIYAKTRRNLDRAAARHGFTWRDPAAEEKRALLGELAAIAGEAGLRPRLCAQPELPAPGLTPAACIDAARLSALADREIAAPLQANRPGCLCARARDIGAYDTCPHGCAYCYAVRDPALAKRQYRALGGERAGAI
jgi:hypothetical protein